VVFCFLAAFLGRFCAKIAALRPYAPENLQRGAIFRIFIKAHQAPANMRIIAGTAKNYRFS
jgi:hypothetical protein